MRVQITVPPELWDKVCAIAYSEHRYPKQQLEAIVSDALESIRRDCVMNEIASRLPGANRDNGGPLSAAQSTPPRLLRASEAARYMGVSRSFVYLLMASGELPCVRIRGLPRVDRARLDDWLDHYTSRSM